MPATVAVHIDEAVLSIVAQLMEPQPDVIFKDHAANFFIVPHDDPHLQSHGIGIDGV